MYENKIKDDEIIGQRVRVKSCDAAPHGFNPNCVCHLKGKVITIDRRKIELPLRRHPIAPLYHIIGMTQCVRRSQVALLRYQYDPAEIPARGRT